EAGPGAVADAEGAREADVEGRAAVPDAAPDGPLALCGVVAAAVPDAEAVVPSPDLNRFAAAVPAEPAATALRTERSAPRSFSPASAPRLLLTSRSPGCSGSGTTFVASAGSWSARPGAGALMTAFNRARAPLSSSRWAGSLVSSP